MDIFENAERIWNSTQTELASRPWNRRLILGDMNLSHYIGFLTETYHNAGLNPQLMAYTTLFIQGRPRDVFKKLFQHSTSELGHDLLALNDLNILGVNSDLIINSKPLPETKAFFANTVYNIQMLGVPAFLAYLFHLEYTPTKNGPGIMALLTKLGVPHTAMTFLEEHSTVDIQHLKLMKTYMGSLINSQADVETFERSLYECSILHNRMLEASFENGEALFKTAAA